MRWDVERQNSTGFYFGLFKMKFFTKEKRKKKGGGVKSISVNSRDIFSLEQSNKCYFNRMIILNCF